jgi:hypothetical protein
LFFGALLLTAATFLCMRCGMISAAGKHETLEDCIDALRGRLADLE